MAFKRLALPLFIVGFVFIGFGDRFLPAPLSTISFSSRTSINQFLLGLSPDLKSQDPDANTEKAVNELPH